MIQMRFRLQNTCDRGWHGINIDPLKSSIDKFKNSRPRDVNLNYAISSSPHVFIEKNGPLIKFIKTKST